MATTEALSPAEWLEAARLRLRDDGDPVWSDEGLRLVEVTAEQRKSPGFIGDSAPIRVTVATAGGVTRILPFFLKAVPAGSEGRARAAVSSRSFVKETGLFQRVFPRMRGGETAPWGPRCFLARPPTLIVMEDLACDGFRCWPPRTTLDFPHCVHALSAVARFHAAALALEDRESTLAGAPFRLGDHFPDLLEENMFTADLSSLMAAYFHTSLEDLKHVVGLIPKYKASDSYCDILRRIDEVPDLAYRLVKPSERYRNVICNGDLWVTNFLFKYANDVKRSRRAEEDEKEVSKGLAKLVMKGKGEDVAEEVAKEAKEEENRTVKYSGEPPRVPSEPPVAVRIIDFQTARYTPPALDVMTFLHLTTRRGLREARSHDLLEAYHGALRRELNARGLRVEDLVPWADFVASCEEYAAFGRIITASYVLTDLLPAHVLDAQAQTPAQYEKIFTEPRRALVDGPFETDEYYRERVTEIVEEFVDFVVLGL